MGLPYTVGGVPYIGEPHIFRGRGLSYWGSIYWWGGSHMSGGPIYLGGGLSYGGPIYCWRGPIHWGVPYM